MKNNPIPALPFYALVMILLLAAACQPATAPLSPMPTASAQPGVTAVLSQPSQTPTLSATPTASPPAPTATTVSTNTPLPAAATFSMSAANAKMWRIYTVEGYGISFLYPKDWQVKALDANHLQVPYKDTALTIGYRFTDKKISLAPVISQKDLTAQSRFPFLGEDLTIYTSTDEQSSWKAFYYDGGGELTRGRLAFTLRLENVDQSKSLGSLSSGEFQEFTFIVGSFMVAPQHITDAAGTKVNLAKLGLEQIQSIEIGVFNPQISANRYLYQNLINDPAMIAKLVKTLNSDIPIQPAATCIESYEIIFHLADNRKVTFGYQCGEKTAVLTRGLSADGSIALGGSIAVSTEFTEILQSGISQAEVLRDNKALPTWKARIGEHDGKAGPFTLEEYEVLDTGRWAPYSFEFRAIIPDSVFERRASIRQGEGVGWPIPPIQLNGHKIEVNETWGQTTPQNYAVVQQDGVEIFRIATRGPAGTSPIKGLWAWNEQWVLEVESHIVINGKELNATLGAQESFDWQIMAGKPFAFVVKDGQVDAWYNGTLYPLGYDLVVHNQCCEAGAFNPGHNAQMVWFYARKDGMWRYVEMGLY